MATNLDPDSSAFTTVNMLTKGGEDGTQEFFDALVENTGFNWLGFLTKARFCVGEKNFVIDGTSDVQSVDVTFSSDKRDGYSTFSNTNYQVFITLNDPDMNETHVGSGLDDKHAPWVFTIKNKAVGGFRIQYYQNNWDAGTIGLGRGSHTFTFAFLVIGT